MCGYIRAWALVCQLSAVCQPRDLYVDYNSLFMYAGRGASDLFPVGVGSVSTTALTELCAS